jgi:hypothetical protein
VPAVFLNMSIRQWVAIARSFKATYRLHFQGPKHLLPTDITVLEDETSIITSHKNYPLKRRINPEEKRLLLHHHRQV